MPLSVKFESGIPMPARSACLIGQQINPLIGMEIGDSFLWQGHPNVVYRAAKRNGFKLTGRKINGEGVRYWRTK